MSIRFDAVADELSRSASVPGTPGTYTWLGWIRPIAISGYSSVWYTGAVVPTGTGYTQMYLTASGAGFKVSVDGNFLNGGVYDETSDTERALDAWYFVAMVRSGTTITIYVGTTTAAAAQSFALVGTGTPAPTLLQLGGDINSDGYFYNGRMQAVRYYDGVALSLAEIQAEQWTQLPHRTSSLWAWWPVLIHTEAGDYSGNGRDLTSAGTLATEDGPPVAWRRSATRTILPAAAAGGEISGTLAVTLGAVTAGGASTLEIQAAASVTLGAVTNSAIATLEIQGATSQTLAAVTSQGAGTLPIDASSSVTLAAVSLAASAALEIRGTTSLTLGAVTSEGSGVVGGAPIEGTLSATLGAITPSAAGALELRAESSVTLGPVTASGASTTAIAAALSQTLGNVTLAAAASGDLAGALAATLAPVTSGGASALEIRGALAVTLGPIVLEQESSYQPFARPGDLLTAALVASRHSTLLTSSKHTTELREV